MASATIQGGLKFPESTVLAAYPASGWRPDQQPPSGAPVGSSAGAATVTNGVALFTGLQPKTRYYAYASVASEDRYVQFTTSDLTVAQEALSALSRDLQQAGEYAVPPGAGHATYTTVANQGRIVRWVPSEDRLIRKIGFIVGTAAAANDECCVAVLNGQTLARLATSGIVTGKLNAAANARSCDLLVPYQARAGSAVYLGFSNGALGGTAATMQGLSYSFGQSSEMFGTAAGLYEFGTMASAHPIPDPFVRAQAGSAPLLAAME